MMLNPTKEIPARASRLRSLAADAEVRGLPTCAAAMREAASDLEQMLAVHKALCEREEILTARLVAFAD